MIVRRVYVCKENDIHRGLNNKYISLAHMGVILSLLSCLMSCHTIIIIL